MHRYFVHLAYDGTRYHGWQIQPNAISVQQLLNEALSTLLRHTVAVVGAGRTDTGVHARLMAAHFDHPGEPLTAEEREKLVYKLHKLLPPDIDVQAITPVSPTAHARFDAIERTYHYYVITRHDAFLRHYAHRPHIEPSFATMNRAAAHLLQCRDFTSFSKLHTDVKTNICHVTKAEWTQTAPHVWRFEITADRFLRNMVRAIVGTLLQVGQGKISEDAFARIIERRDRCSAGDSAPANALFLVDVKYPPHIFTEQPPRPTAQDGGLIH